MPEDEEADMSDPRFGPRLKPLEDRQHAVAVGRFVAVSASEF